MELYYHGLTDPGMIRDNNEDYFFAGKLSENEYLFVVADGMGGHQAGEVASRKAVSLLVQQLERGTAAPGNNQDILHHLRETIIDINESLMQEGSRSQKKNGMGTTLSALYIKNDLGYIVHVGDSRIYLYLDTSTDSDNAQQSPGHLKQLTEDHSFVGKLVKDGFITEEEARSHPKRNVLYQSIGLKRDITIQTTGAIPIFKGQKYLLCSDGLYGVVPDHEIRGYLHGTSTVKSAEQLIKRANFNGGPDNISVIVVSTEPDDPTELTDTVKITNSSPQKNKKSKGWFFLLLGLMVLLLALIIYFLLLNAKADSYSPSLLKKDNTTTEKYRETLDAKISKIL